MLQADPAPTSADAPSVRVCTGHLRVDDPLKVAPQQRAQGGVRPDRLRQRVRAPARVGRQREHRRWQRRQGAFQGDPRIHAVGHKIGARRLCGFRQLLTAHSQSRAPVQGATVKPKTVKPKTPKTVNKTVNPKTTYKDEDEKGKAKVCAPSLYEHTPFFALRVPILFFFRRAQYESVSPEPTSTRSTFRFGKFFSSKLLCVVFTVVVISLGCSAFALSSDGSGGVSEFLESVFAPVLGARSKLRGDLRHPHTHC